MSKRVMILGAAKGQLPLIEKAKQLGFYTLVASIAGDYPGFRAADEAVFVDLFDRQAVLDAAQRHRVEGIVFDQSEAGVRSGAFACNGLGLPCFSYDAACLFTDKSLASRRAAALGIPTPFEQTAVSLRQAQEVIGQMGLPCVIKPADGSASRGVTILTDQAHLAKAFDGAMSESPKKQVLIQEYLTGQEVAVEGFIYQNQIYPLTFGRRYWFDFKGNSIFKATVFSPQTESEFAAPLADYCVRLYSGLDIHAAMFQAEFRQDRRGRWALLDAAIRGGGALISSHIVHLATGFDLHKAYLQAACGILPELPHGVKTTKTAGYVCFLLPQGIVRRSEGYEKLAGIRGLAYHTFEPLAAGKKSDAPKDKRFRYGPFALVADGEPSFWTIREQIKASLRIEIQTADGVQSPIWE